GAGAARGTERATHNRTGETVDRGLIGAAGFIPAEPHRGKRVTLTRGLVGETGFPPRPRSRVHPGGATPREARVLRKKGARGGNRVSPTLLVHCLGHGD